MLKFQLIGQRLIINTMFQYITTIRKKDTLSMTMIKLISKVNIESQGSQ